MHVINIKIMNKWQLMNIQFNSSTLFMQTDSAKFEQNPTKQGQNLQIEENQSDKFKFQQDHNQNQLDFASTICTPDEEITKFNFNSIQSTTLTQQNYSPIESYHHSVQQNQTLNPKNEIQNQSVNLSIKKIDQCLQQLKLICPDISIYKIVFSLAERLGLRISNEVNYLMEEKVTKQEQFERQSQTKSHNFFLDESDFEKNVNTDNFSQINTITKQEPQQNKIQEENKIEIQELEPESESEEEEQIKSFIPSHKKYFLDRGFRKQQIAIAKHFIEHGYDMISYNNANPKRKVNYKRYSIHIVSIGNNVIKDIETYLLLNTDRYLTKLKNKEKCPLRSILAKIKLWLQEKDLLETYLTFIKLHYGMVQYKDVTIAKQKVRRLYEIILTALKKDKVVLFRKKTDDVNFYHIKKADIGYTLTSQELEQLLSSAIQLRDIHKMQRQLAEKYNWNKYWFEQPRYRRASLIDKLTNIIRAKIRAISLISNLNEKEKYTATVEARIVKSLLLPPSSHDQNIKNFFKGVYEYSSQKTTTQMANQILRFLINYKQAFQKRNAQIKNLSIYESSINQNNISSFRLQTQTQPITINIDRKLKKKYQENQLQVSNNQQDEIDKYYSTVSQMRIYKKRLINKKEKQTYDDLAGKFIQKTKSKQQMLNDKKNYKTNQFLSTAPPRKVGRPPKVRPQTNMIQNNNMRMIEQTPYNQSQLFNPHQFEQFQTFLKYQKFLQQQNINNAMIQRQQIYNHNQYQHMYRNRDNLKARNIKQRNYSRSKQNRQVYSEIKNNIKKSNQDKLSIYTPYSQNNVYEQNNYGDEKQFDTIEAQLRENSLMQNYSYQNQDFQSQQLPQQLHEQYPVIKDGSNKQMKKQQYDFAQKYQPQVQIDNESTVSIRSKQQIKDQLKKRLMKNTQK